MTKNIMKRIMDIMTFTAIAYFLYLGYFIYFDKPTNPEGIASLYVQFGRANAFLFLTSLARALLIKK